MTFKKKLCAGHPGERAHTDCHHGCTRKSRDKGRNHF